MNNDYIQYRNAYIEHYGVKGMKWRFSKFTNKVRRGGRDVYEYFTKKTYGKSKASKLGAAPGIGSVSSLGPGRTQFQRDLRKATKPLRKSFRKFYKNSIDPSVRRFKLVAPIKAKSLAYRLGGIKGKLISRLNGYNRGPATNVTNISARSVKNAKAADHTKALTNKLYANSRSLNEVTEERTLNGETLYKHGYRANKYNPYWGTNGSYNRNNKRRTNSQSDYSKYYKYKRNKGATNPYWGRR